MQLLLLHAAGAVMLFFAAAAIRVMTTSCAATAPGARWPVAAVPVPEPVDPWRKLELQATPPPAGGDERLGAVESNGS
jgi:hypothetical protein